MTVGEITIILVIMEIAFFVLLAIYFLLRKVEESKVQKPRRVYKQKGEHLLSISELRFYETLKKSKPAKTYICPMVRIADVIDVDDYLAKTDKAKFWEKLRAINQKHVDFLLCWESDFTPLLAIELDDASHKDSDRLSRDMKINWVFRNAGIPILHIKATGQYDRDEIYKKIRDKIWGD